MQVLFTSRDHQGAAMRDLAVRRIRFAMRRMTWLVPRATVQLSDINGPRGGIDKRCQLLLKTEQGGLINVTSVASDWRSAIDVALERAIRVLRRLWQRRQDRRAPDRRQAQQLLIKPDH